MSKNIINGLQQVTSTPSSNDLLKYSKSGVDKLLKISDIKLDIEANPYYSSGIEVFNIDYGDGVKRFYKPIPSDFVVTFYYKDSSGNTKTSISNVSRGGTAIPPSDYNNWEGHNFLRWDRGYTNVQENLVVNAVYDVSQLTVTFRVIYDYYTDATDYVAGYERLVEVKSCSYGGSVIAPSAPVIEGQVFNGWDRNDYVSNVTSNLVVTGYYRKNNYTISGVVNPSGAGSISGAGTKQYLSEFSLTQSPASGYNFSHWTYPGGGTGETNPSGRVLGDTSYIANYVVNKYLVDDYLWIAVEEGNGSSNGSEGYLFHIVNNGLNVPENNAWTGDGSMSSYYTRSGLIKSCNDYYNAGACHYWIKLARYQKYNDGTYDSDSLVGYYLLPKWNAASVDTTKLGYSSGLLNHNPEYSYSNNPENGTEHSFNYAAFAGGSSKDPVFYAGTSITIDSSSSLYSGKSITLIESYVGDYLPRKTYEVIGGVNKYIVNIANYGGGTSNPQHYYYVDYSNWVKVFIGLYRMNGTNSPEQLTLYYR